jgi:hypothetical protein
MEIEITELLEKIKEDYLNFKLASEYAHTEISKKMIVEFNDGLKVLTGKKYIKIEKENSVWGFIVNTETDKKFRKGDILMAASFKAPARNHARGNIIDGDYQINWTGPNYLI